MDEYGHPRKKKKKRMHASLADEVLSGLEVIEAVTGEVKPANDHTHSIRLTDDDMQGQNDIELVTGSAGKGPHKHKVFVQAYQVREIFNNEMVMLQSDEVEDHVHSIIFAAGGRQGESTHKESGMTETSELIDTIEEMMLRRYHVRYNSGEGADALRWTEVLLHATDDAEAKAKIEAEYGVTLQGYQFEVVGWTHDGFPAPKAGDPVRGIMLAIPSGDYRGQFDLDYSVGRQA